MHLVHKCKTVQDKMNEKWFSYRVGDYLIPFNSCSVFLPVEFCKFFRPGKCLQPNCGRQSCSASVALWVVRWRRDLRDGQQRQRQALPTICLFQAVLHISIYYESYRGRRANRLAHIQPCGHTRSRHPFFERSEPPRSAKRSESTFFILLKAA